MEAEWRAFISCCIIACEGTWSSALHMELSCLVHTAVPHCASSYVRHRSTVSQSNTVHRQLFT